jgi:hypothetical protein
MMDLLLDSRSRVKKNVTRAQEKKYRDFAPQSKGIYKIGHLAFEFI